MQRAGHATCMAAKVGSGSSRSRLNIRGTKGISASSAGELTPSACSFSFGSALTVKFRVLSREDFLLVKGFVVCSALEKRDRDMESLLCSLPSRPSLPESSCTSIVGTA